MPRVLITGVTGFVGRHLVRALGDDGAGFEIFGTAYPGPAVLRGGGGHRARPAVGIRSAADRPGDAARLGLPPGRGFQRPEFLDRAPRNRGNEHPGDPPPPGIRPPGGAARPGFSSSAHPMSMGTRNLRRGPSKREIPFRILNPVRLHQGLRGNAVRLFRLRRGPRHRRRPPVPPHRTGAIARFRLLRLGAADRPDRDGGKRTPSSASGTWMCNGISATFATSSGRTCS